MTTKAKTAQLIFWGIIATLVIVFLDLAGFMPSAFWAVSGLAIPLKRS